MKYTKPEVVAQNSKKGSFAAGCPARNGPSHAGGCVVCEHTK